MGANGLDLSGTLIIMDLFTIKNSHLKPASDAARMDICSVKQKADNPIC
jgi:hypothetical protein